MTFASAILGPLWLLFCQATGLVTILSLIFYLLPLFYLTFIARPQNLRNKYGNWAVVTGASSGIGQAITERLASQGINVALVALDNDALPTTISTLSSRFPNLEFRSIPADLSRDPEEYMRSIREGTADIPISMVFSNAGFLVMGFFEQKSVDVHVANLECNATAGIRIVHHFYKRMVSENIKGCFVFTSSAVSFMPSPFAVMYGGSKALLSHFATSFAIEADKHGIDVTVVHPSYTHSNLYAKAPKLDIIKLLHKLGWTPRDVADATLASVGRVKVRDLGSYALVTNLLSRMFDLGFLTSAFIPFRDSMAPSAEK